MLHLTRTSFVFLGLVAGSLSTASAATVYNETLVHDTTTTVNIDLNEDTVLCSSADYGALFLKVALPELAGLTLMDHQNIGAGAPCVAAGVCEPGHMPENIIDAAHPTENVSINVKAFRQDEVDTTAETCNTTLIERVHVTIRGFEFTHERRAELGSRLFGDCVSTPATGSGSGSGDNPADDPGSVDEAPAAGCSAGGAGAGSTFALVMLGALIAFRRKQRAV